MNRPLANQGFSLIGMGVGYILFVAVEPDISPHQQTVKLLIGAGFIVLGAILLAIPPRRNH
jgi:hypothetical protein